MARVALGKAESQARFMNVLYLTGKAPLRAKVNLRYVFFLFDRIALPIVVGVHDSNQMREQQRDPISTSEHRQLTLSQGI